jgi:hypothetical protein
MAMEGGGKASKFGNRYEGRWTVRRLLHLLSGGVSTVKIEAIGEDERGVDLWIRTENGSRFAEQCKRQDGTQPGWTVRRLRNLGVLDYAKRQLQRDPSCRYRFVSATPAGKLKDLSERASSSDTPKVLAAEILKHSNLATAFKELCQAWGLDESSDEGATEAISLLARCEWETGPDGSIGESDLQMLCELHVDGTASNVVSVLADLALVPTNLGRELDQTEIWRQLGERDLHPRNLVNDPRISQQIDRLADSFLEAFEDRAQGDTLMLRSQAPKILSHLLSQEDKGICIVSGAAGYGKSGVLWQVARELKSQGVPFLGLRFDDQPIEATSGEAYGQALGLRCSPPAALAACHPSRLSVLIIDQLDAIRWRIANSERAWTVVKEMVYKVAQSGNVRVLVACRSFDLDHDPLFKLWQQNAKNFRLDVGELDEDQLREELGTEVWQALGEPQRRILRRALNLHLWRRLQEEGGQRPRFATSLDLMRAFWAYCYKQIDKTATGAEPAREALLALTMALQSNAELSVPELRFSPKLAQGFDLLQSLGIVRRRESRVSFWHQSFGDYQIAEQLFQQIAVGGDAVQSVSRWLGTRRDQSLFRRGQVQLLSQLVSEAIRDQFLPMVQAIVETADVRFHIKLLMLQVLSDISAPNSSEQAFVIRLVNDPKWANHAHREILFGKPAWIGAPQIRDLVRSWLLEGTAQQSGIATWLLRSVVSTLPDFAADCLEECERKGGELLNRVDHVLSVEEGLEPDRIFELRLRAMQAGRWKYYANWKKVLEASQIRFLRLLGAWLDRFFNRALLRLRSGKSLRDANDRDSSLKHVSKDDLKLFVEAAVAEPRLTWDTLVPTLASFYKRLRIVRRRADHTRRHLLRYEVQRLMSNCRVVEAIATAAGQKLVQSNLSSFFESLEGLPLRAHRLLPRIVLGSLAAAELADADRIVDWLRANLPIVPCGSQAGKSRWQPVRRLLRRFGASCSDECLQKFEAVVRSWRRPVELESIRLRHQFEVPHGYLPPNRMGEAAYFMLAALPANRLSETAKGELGCFQRKFEGCHNRVFGERLRGRGGRFRSAIDNARCQTFSNETWLRLISSNGAQRIKEDWRRTCVVESSARAFAGNLGWAAARDPSRFAKLGLLLPLTVADAYFEQLWWNISSVRPRSELSDDEKSRWSPAQAEELEGFYWHVESRNVEMVDAGFCRAVQERPDEEWSERTLQKISELCCHHPSPGPRSLSFVQEWEERTLENLETTAINHVRSLSAMAIEELLFADPTGLPRFEGAIETLIADPHPSVRIAATGTILPIWNIDKRRAFDLFMRLCNQSDDQVLASRNVTRFLNHAQNHFSNELLPLVLRMLASRFSGARRHAAARIAIQHWHFDRWHSEYSTCITSKDIETKRGLIDILDDVLIDNPQKQNAVDEYVQYFDDSDKTIRDAARTIFGRWSAETHAIMCALAGRFVGTKAFLDDPTYFLLWLNNATGSVAEIAEPVFRVCDEARRLLSGPMDGTQPVFHADQLATALLRIYDACQTTGDRDLQDQCLDAWDVFLESGLGTARDMLAQLTND